LVYKLLEAADAPQTHRDTETRIDRHEPEERVNAQTAFL